MDNTKNGILFKIRKLDDLTYAYSLLGLLVGLNTEARLKVLDYALDLFACAQYRKT